jgi:hypothetical protein
MGLVRGLDVSDRHVRVDGRFENIAQLPRPQNWEMHRDS